MNDLAEAVLGVWFGGFLLLLLVGGGIWLHPGGDGERPGGFLVRISFIWPLALVVIGLLTLWKEMRNAAR